MARKHEPADTPDVLLTSEDGREWAVFCRLCVRTVGPPVVGGCVPYARAHEHLLTSHGLQRVRIDRMQPGYREMVQAALPLVVEHDLTLATDYRGQ
jgi:hypothetical protein